MQWERECGFLALKIGLGRTSWLITPHTYLQPGVNLRTLYLISRFNKNTFKSPLSNLHSFHKLNLKSTPERDTFHYSVGATCAVLAELWISRDSHGMPGASARPMHDRARHWIGTARAGQQGGSQWERFVNTWSLFPINLRCQDCQGPARHLTRAFIRYSGCSSGPASRGNWLKSYHSF